MGMETNAENLHSVSESTMKNLPELLKNPVMMMDSKQKGKAVAFVNAKDKDGNPVLCAIQIDGKGNYNNVEIDSNVVLSVYGKDINPIGYIEKAVDDGRMVYWNKKMSQELFETPGRQLPNNLKHLDSDTILHKFGEVVKPFSEKNLSEDRTRKLIYFMMNFIEQYKTTGYDAGGFEILRSKTDNVRSLLFLDIAEEVYHHYQDTLKQRNERLFLNSEKNLRFC